MIDIHSHILPGVDDGAKTLEDALSMLRMAVANGITTQVLTSHIQTGRYDNSPTSLRKSFSDFVDVVNNHKIPIRLLLSAEVRIEPELLSLLEQDDFPWLGMWDDKRAFLLEMPHNHLPVGSLNLVKHLIEHDIMPVIVHPERNRECQQNINKLVPLIDAGCKIQITAGSLTSNFGHKAKDTAVQLLKAGMVMFLATDSHSPSYRPPDLMSGLKIAEKIIGSKKANMLVNDTPKKLCQLSQ